MVRLPQLDLAPRKGPDCGPLRCRGQDFDLVELGAGLGNELDVVGHGIGRKGEIDPGVRLEVEVVDIGHQRLIGGFRLAALSVFGAQVGKCRIRTRVVADPES